MTKVNSSYYFCVQRTSFVIRFKSKGFSPMYSDIVRVVVAFCALFSTAVLGQPLTTGHYNSISSGPFPSIDVNVDGFGGNTVSMDATSGASGCTGVFSTHLMYTLPANYRGEAINYTVGTCSGQLSCNGILINCAGVGPGPATFVQLNKTDIEASSSLWSGSESFSLVSTYGRKGAKAQARPNEFIKKYHVIKSDKKSKSAILDQLGKQ